MIVTCPNCSTNFKVPEQALGNKGRNLRCCRCSHVWFHANEPIFDEVPLEAASSIDPRRTLPRDEVTDQMFADEDMVVDLALAQIDEQGFAGEGAERLRDEDEDPFAEMSDLMRSSRPDSMPDMMAPRAPKPAPRRKGGFILWLVPALLLPVIFLGALYYFQEPVINHWPGLGKYYEMLGVRDAEVGVGLQFRNYNSERMVQDNNEVLIVRGVIANATELKKDIPLLRLALYDGATLLQEKIIPPPQLAIDPHGTVGFKVMLDQPDPKATRFEVTFTKPKPTEK